MKKNATMIVMGALVMAWSLTATAATPSRAEVRQAIQQQYIFSALYDGRVSWGDAKSLLQEQDAVRTWLDRFQGEGFTMKEVAVLDYMLDISAKNIDRALRAQAARQDAPRPDVAPIQLAGLTR